ncbi:hypothetical protein L916_17367 [Phytophthora nicotianae]|uniref:Pyruvate dehydrogenase E1 component subunit beta n=1 Tax=Phytophthora nicotianae TaxID=4792 RepID=W2I5Q9_PHYNI|nr:hypothetical protein L916_17367 [Phytophthora nicotianae]
MNMRDILSTSMGEELPCDVEVFLMGEEVAEYNGAYKISKCLRGGGGGGGSTATSVSLTCPRQSWASRVWPSALSTTTPSLYDVQLSRLLARSLTHPPSCMPNGDIHVPIVFCGLNCPVAGVLPLIIRSATPPGCHPRPNPAVVLENELTYSVSFSVSKEAQDKDFVIEFGKAKVMMPGTNVTVVAFSRTVGEALMPLLRGNRRRVNNLGSIRPFDRQAIIDSVKTTNHIVSIEKGWGQSGIDVEIVGIIIEMEAFDYLDISLERVTYRYPTSIVLKSKKEWRG